MRVLFLTDRLSNRSGSDFHLRQMMHDSLDAGLQVSIAFGHGDRSAMAPPGVRQTRVKALAAKTCDRSQLRRLECLVGETDVVHLVNIMNPLAIAMAVASRRAVATVQDHRIFCPGPGKTLPRGQRCTQLMSEAACAACLPDERYRHRTLELTRQRRTYLAGAHLLVLSSYMARELTASGLGPVEVLPPWIAPRPRPLVAGSGFLVAGRLVPHKGVLDAWKAWCESGSDQPLLVAGSGSEADRLEGATRLGWLEQDRLRATLHGARALLFPTRWQEPFGILGPQSLAAGTPVVVANAGGTNDWSARGCLHVPPADITAMSAAIERLSSDADLAMHLGSQGRQWISRRYRRDRIAARLLRIYEARA